jgi:hypothetical protein
MAGYSHNKRTWYSDTKPKGKGYIDPSEYDYDMADAMERVYYNNPSLLGIFTGKEAEPRDKAEVVDMQVFLKNLGYFDTESEVDSLWGPKTAGASHRYLLNRPGTLARIVDWMIDE